MPADSPDLIGRDFTAAAPGTRLVGDLTHLRTGEGRRYPATVIDLATRMVVGWQLADHMRTSLVVDALTMAIDAGHVEHEAIFPSDRGCQYTSAESARLCAGRRVRTSVGRTGVCWDNAAAETFFAALKNEMYHRQTSGTRARARFAVADHIEVFHNRRRLHSTMPSAIAAEALGRQLGTAGFAVASRQANLETLEVLRWETGKLLDSFAAGIRSDDYWFYDNPKTGSPILHRVHNLEKQDAPQCATLFSSGFLHDPARPLMGPVESRFARW